MRTSDWAPPSLPRSFKHRGCGPLVPPPTSLTPACATLCAHALVHLPTFLPQASEVEETLKRIQSHRGVEGILIVNNDGVPLKSTLSAEQTTQYASLFSQLSSKARSVVRTLDATVSVY